MNNFQCPDRLLFHLAWIIGGYRRVVKGFSREASAIRIAPNMGINRAGEGIAAGYFCTSRKAGTPTKTTSTPNKACSGDREASRSNMSATKARKASGV